MTHGLPNRCSDPPREIPHITASTNDNDTVESRCARIEISDTPNADLPVHVLDQKRYAVSGSPPPGSDPILSRPPCTLPTAI